MMDFLLKNDDLHHKNRLRRRLKRRCEDYAFCIKHEELYFKNEKFCIKNEELYFKNEKFCIKNEELCISKDGFRRAGCDR